MSKEESATDQHVRAAEVSEMFSLFCGATSQRQILGLYWSMCEKIGIRPGPFTEFYPKLRSMVSCWKAESLWKKLDNRASQRVYNGGKAAIKTRVLIIGAGPCGLRSAIEAQLLGAKVVVLEKRDRISRNNVLHLWPFVIHDLKMLGAKMFYGKFCAGSIDHISIRQLQCILLKVALLLGVEVHEGVSFVKEIEPADGYGWRAAIQPEDHAASHYEFDVLIGANGKRNTIAGFQHQEMRGKLAIAITVNFVNKKTEAEVKAQEISGVSFVFNQAFFKELYERTGVDLENIVYYKDDTHYFVMTAKKHSLLEKEVIKQDFANPAELLAQSNVNKEMLYEYAKAAAFFATKYRIPRLEFAVNHYGQPDVSMFDFTSMYNAQNSCRVVVRKNYRLLTCLVGDSLIEPFWPTGSGCAFGFLSSMDAAYAIKMFANPSNSLLATIALRESVFRLLPQVTPEHMNNRFSSYTIDPSTRYRNLNKLAVSAEQVRHLLDTDDPALLEQTSFDANALVANTTPEVPAKRKRRTIESKSLASTILHWVKAQLKDAPFVHELTEPAHCFTHGKVLCTLIHRYRPDLVNLDMLADFGADVCNEHAFMIFEDHLGIPRTMSGPESVSLSGVEQKVWLGYLEQICDVFRGEIPHVKHLKLDYAEFKKQQQQQQTSDAQSWASLGLMAKKRAAMAATAATAAAATSGEPGDVRASESPLPDATAAAARKPSYYHPNAEEERYKRTRVSVASPQSEQGKRAKKRRSYDKSANIDSQTMLGTQNVPKDSGRMFSQAVPSELCVREHRETCR
uniref:F-actin monooxygenase n=1 Tax=Anopheles atroparvus TaxID=41427 RepID=A0A182JAS0_ANOAO